MNSPAGRQSTGTATHPPTAAVTAARAAANEAAGKAGLEAVQTGAGQSKLWRKAIDMPDVVKKVDHQRQEVIPMRRDNDLRAFMIDYLPIMRACQEHSELLNRTFQDRQEGTSEKQVRVSMSHHMMLAAMSQVIEEAKASEFVEGVLERDGNEVNADSSFPIEKTPRQERLVIIDPNAVDPGNIEKGN